MPTPNPSASPSPGRALAFDAVARLPSPEDNTAIATRRIEAGTRITLPGGGDHAVSHTVLLGHRFAVRPLSEGEQLTSWGMPFGLAVRPIGPGEYVCNDVTLQSLRHRELDNAVLPDSANFSEPAGHFEFAPGCFRVGPQVAAETAPRTFKGYDRGPRRGIGTRNTIVILGTSSRTAGLARTLAGRLHPLAENEANLDGIVAVAHTEGGGPQQPNNRLEILRTLAGFLVHPNVAAILAIDDGEEPINNIVLRDFCAAEHYPLDEVPHACISTGADPESALDNGARLVRAWLPAAVSARRTEQPLAALKIALQCGGSDAFSGVSGNPLAAQVAREVIRHGGSAVQAETDEIIGAERYMLGLVRDEQTARRLVEVIDRFRERLAWHGATAEGNPSGGNRLRGLYNIILKSLGAAAKKAPDVRIDDVLDYAQPLRRAGFTFMDSPGNDLESIAGQIATGCNLVFFVTGNGSITNFPFVPTLKFTTTTARHRLLINEMDVNAGAYLDGASMDALAQSTFDLTIQAASGARTKGELAGHSQVSIWRDWRQTGPQAWRAIESRARPDGRPITVIPRPEQAAMPRIHGWRTSRGDAAAERVGLIVPVSLCSGQVAQMAAERLGASGIGRRHGISRFVSLTHAEGCGFTGDQMFIQLLNTYANYARNPNVAAALFLEHGCEKVPNDNVRAHLEKTGLDPREFGWASVQLDGGIARVLERIGDWFDHTLERRLPASSGEIELGALTVGLMSHGPMEPAAAHAFAGAARTLVSGGGSVLLPANDALTANSEFTETLLGKTPSALRPTLELAQWPDARGLHVVATETDSWPENLAALGASGAQLIIALTNGRRPAGHPMLPVAEIASHDMDADQILRLAAQTLEDLRGGTHAANINTTFQITRGLLGVST